MRDNEARTGSSLWVRLGLHATVFTLLGLFDAADSYLRYAYEGEAIPLTRAIPLGLCLWYAWAVLYVFILKLVRRYPLEQGAVRRRLALHLGAGVFFALVKIGMDYPIIKYLYCPHPEILTFPMFFRMGS
jgi:uncharacterized membrane protein YesL